MGHYILTRCEMMDASSGIIQRFHDVDLVDLRYGIDLLARRFNIFESHVQNDYILRPADKWCQGVRILCEGELHVQNQRGRRVDRFHEVMLKHDGALVDHNGHLITGGLNVHPVFRSEISTISAMLGMTLHVHIISPGGNNTHGDDTSLELDCINIYAHHLMIDVRPHSNTWGTNVSPVWGQAHSVLITRQDRQSISRHQVEALCRFCNDVVEPAICELGASKPKQKSIQGQISLRGDQRDLVRRLCFSEQFERFFEDYKAKQVDAGRLDWRGAAPSERTIRTVFDDELLGTSDVVE